MPRSYASPHITARQTRQLGLALRWSYGPCFGLLHGALRRTIGEPWASAAFGGTLMTATFSLFPLLGRTPPPWRWPSDVVATTVATHVVYVGAVAAVDDGAHRILARPLTAATCGSGDHLSAVKRSASPSSGDADSHASLQDSWYIV